MLRTLKKSLIALLAAVMIFSGWSLVNAADGDTSNYEVEVVDSLTYNGMTFSNLANHAKYVKSAGNPGSIFIDQSPDSLDDARNRIRKVLDPDDTRPLPAFDDVTDYYPNMRLVGGTEVALERISKAKDELYCDYSINYFSIIHVKTKSQTGNPISFSTNDPMVLNVRHVCVYEMVELSSDYDKYYLTYVTKDALINSEFSISQGEGSGVLKVPMHKNVRLTKCYIQETEFAEQYSSAVMAGYDKVNMNGESVYAKQVGMPFDYIQGETLHFKFDQLATANGDPDDYLNVRLFDRSTGDEIPSGAFTVAPDFTDPSGLNKLVTIPENIATVGRTLTLRLELLASCDPDVNGQKNLSRPYWDIVVNVVQSKPITSLKFSKSSYNLTTVNNKTIDLNAQLTVAPTDVTDKVFFRSSDPTVATVDMNTGIVTALKIGSTTITAYSRHNANIKTTCTIYVRPDLQAILISGPENIVQGQTAEVDYTLTPSIADGIDPKDITWKSDKTDYLTVTAPNNQGKVTITATGKAMPTGENNIQVTLTATSTNGLVATKNITVWANTPSGVMTFTPALYNERETKLQKSLVKLGADEYNIYDQQSVKIGTKLTNASGQTSTDKLNWRVTIDGTSIENKPLSAGSSYFSFTFNKNAEDKNLIVNFLQEKYATITFTGYAVQDDTNDNISNPHAVKSIIFHVNRKTSSVTTSGAALDNLAAGDEATVNYTLNQNVLDNVDRAYIVSDDPSVLEVVSYTNIGRTGTIELKAKKNGTAHLLIYATYDVDLTSGNQTYYTYLSTSTVRVKYNISKATVEHSVSDKVFKNAEYTAEQIRNEISLSYGGSSLTYNTDYTITLKNNKDVGTCTVVIAGKGSYAGTLELTFEITPYALNANDVITVNGTHTYTGVEITPTVNLRPYTISTTLVANKDYVLSYDNNIDAGTDSAVVYAQGIGNYTGIISKTFTIKQRGINEGGFVTVDNLKAVTYTGAAFTPDIVAKNVASGDQLVKDVDYTLTYSNNTNRGSASVTITGIGNYNSTKPISFTINPRDIKDSGVTVAAIPNQTYNTKDIKPELTIKYNGMTLKYDVDYTANYVNNVHAGTATVTINAKGNYDNYGTGRTVTFKIDPYVLTAGNTNVNVARAEYTGKPLTPNVDVKVIDFNRFLDKTNECTISHSNNIDAGNGGVVTVKGKGDYAGTFTYNFKIEPTSINNTDIEAIPEEFYDGTEHKPDIVAKNRVTGNRLQAGADYYLEYDKNIEQGNATVIINGKGNYTGQTTRNFRIAAANIANATFSSIPDQTFNFGEGIRPSVAVVFDGSKLVEDKDYRVEYRDNYNVGTATMTFIGLGDFGGKYEKTFKIKPFKLTSSNIKITLDEVTYDGKAKTPFVKVELKSNGRVLGRNDEGNGDYKVTFSNNVNAGNNTASVVITGTKNFTGSVTQKFSIKGVEINRAGNEGIEPKAYTGKAITPKVKLTFGDKTLKEGTDYKLSYKDNVKPGEATIVVTGLGNFFGTKEIKFRIKPAAVRFNADSMDVVAGETKRMPFDADEKVTWTSSNKKVCTVNANGEVTGKMAGKVTITGKSESGITASITVQVLYKDVTNTGDFWYKPTYYLTNIDVVKGYDNQTTFKPANECTRGQMVTFLWRLQGCPNPKTTVSKFKDVKKSDYFFKAVLWGNENHIVEGYKDGTFGPKIVCQRKHAVTFMWRLAGKPNPKTTKNKFSDVKTKDYFYKAVLWASEKKIVEGYAGGKFKPDGNCLRRQMVTFLYKYDKFVNGKG